jgi:hypothetical protein
MRELLLGLARPEDQQRLDMSDRRDDPIEVAIERVPVAFFALPLASTPL